MSLVEQINEALRAAMKAQDATQLGTLRLVRSELKNLEISNRTDGTAAPLSDDVVASRLRTMIKQRQESVEMYEKGGRPELAAKEQAEIACISKFLPPLLTPEETATAAQETVAQLGATSVKDMGAVIDALKTKYGARLDARIAANVVRGLLG